MPQHAARPKGRVIVVGSSNTDLVVHCARLPGPGETVLGGDLLTFAGGKGANQAVAAARGGAKAHFIGAFGDDAFGRARRADLEKEGVDCSGCVVKKGVPSGVALIAIGEGKAKARAENLIVVAPGANRRLTPADLRRSLRRLTDDDVLVVCLEIPFATVLAALRAVSRAGARTILNPAPSPGRPLPEAFLRAAHVITPNESEAAALFGADLQTQTARSRMLKALQGNCTSIVVTRGEKGVMHFYRYRDGRGPVKGPVFNAADGIRWSVHGPPGKYKLGTEIFPAPKVKPVDTVGAGDCFNGCLAARLAQDGLDMEGAIRFALAAAALKVTRHGAQAGMPYRGEILKMMAKTQ